MQDLNQLQAYLRQFAKDRDWDQFHSPKNLTMALSVEISELLENFQWLTEEQSYTLDQQQRAAVVDEIADVQMYLARLADKLDINIGEAIEQKINKNEAKYPAELVKGSSKKYTEYVKEEQQEEQQESQKDETPAGKKG
jgi:NTP pyrophosphatase (non-canonical NTP hydrolase)